MTAIVPHIPLMRHDPVSRLPVAGTGPDNSFASLLTGGQDMPQAETPEIFTFAELGMFGRHGSLDGTPEPENNGRSGLSMNGSLPTRDDSIEADHGEMSMRTECTREVCRDVLNGTYIQTRVPVPATALADPGPADAPDLQIPALANVVRDVKPVAGTDEPLATDKSGKGTMPRTVLLRPPVTASADTASVVINISGTTANIIARSGAGTPGAGVRLRHLAAETLAEFGLDLADLHLDGSQTGPSFSSITGGNHGARQR